MQCNALRFALQLSGKIEWAHHIASCLQDQGDRPDVWFLPIVTDLSDPCTTPHHFFLLDCIAILPAEPFLLPDRLVLPPRLAGDVPFQYDHDPCDRTNSPAIRPSFLPLASSQPQLA
jgi:hypothetical protein